MEHKALAVTTTVTDQELGSFEALVSAWGADREGEGLIAAGEIDREADRAREHTCAELEGGK